MVAREGRRTGRRPGLGERSGTCGSPQGRSTADRPALHTWLAERVGAPVAGRITAIWTPEGRVDAVVNQITDIAGPPPCKTEQRSLPDWAAAVTPWVDSLPDRVHGEVVRALAVLVADTRNVDADDAHRALLSVMPRRIGRRAA